MSKASATQPSPKRECHKCPLNGKGDDYCWKSCLGPADGTGNGKMSNKGVSKVSLSAMPAEDEFLYRNSARPYPFPGPDEGDDADHGGVTALDFNVERGLVKVLATFMSLSDVQLCIFRHIYNGENIAQTGRSLFKPMSKQAVSKHLYAMRDLSPTLRRIIGALVKLEGNGSKRRDENDAGTASGNARAEQLDLFGSPAGNAASQPAVANGGKVCTNVTRPRARQQCTPTRRKLST